MKISLNTFGKAGEEVLVLKQHATIQARGRCRMNIRACPAKNPHLFHVLKALQEPCQVQIGLGFSPEVYRVLADRIEVAMGTVPTSHWLTVLPRHAIVCPKRMHDEPLDH